MSRKRPSFLIKRKKTYDSEHTDRWVVSYSDFITLLFAFFAVMYGLSSINEGKYKVMSESIAKAFKLRAKTSASFEGIGYEPVISNELGLSAFRGSDYNKTHRLLQKLEDEGMVTVNQEKRGVVVGVAEQGVFAQGEAQMLADSMTALDEVAGLLKDMPNQIRVEGHTDNVPIKTEKYPSNWELSSARAGAILKYLVEKHGINPSRLSVTGYGEYRPFASNDTAEGRAMNRRVDIVILSTDGSVMEPLVGTSGPLH
ncbi:MAG: OmpA family protein [Deltaproteobacteria bacterium]|nr:OmpA family protein [Deltaproteobacteria bacterium]